MKYYTLDAEVAGRLAPGVRDTATHPPRVTRLHDIMDGWLGDELLESFPCYIVTDRLANKIRRSSLTGVTFDEALVTQSDEFAIVNPKCIVPTFVWLKVDGRPGSDDFGISKDYRSIVSERTLQLLNLKHSKVVDYSE